MKGGDKNMFTWINKRLRDEEGFTLIELMVVVLIIAILIAIAIPTFLGARRRAQDRQAQSNIRNALTAAKTYYSDKQLYSATTTDYSAIETSLTFTTTPTTADAAQRQVGVSLPIVTNTDVICLGSVSKSGTTFLLLDVASDPTASNAGTWFDSGTSPSCPASLGAGGPGGTWSKGGW
jgi:type IV pilus assembly protein PilA